MSAIVCNLLITGQKTWRLRLDIGAMHWHGVRGEMDEEDNLKIAEELRTELHAMHT